jgi:flagellar motor switch protein FliN/FliY
MDNARVAKKIQFTQLPIREKGEPKGSEISFFRRIPLTISGELGAAQITVQELLNLTEGSVIKLNKIAGESAAILVNEQYLGEAEVVVVNDRFGLRVTSIGMHDADKKNPGE